MDGGGRVLEPLTAGYPGLAAGRPAPRPGQSRFKRVPVFLPRLPVLRRKRRSFVAVPLARRIPRLTGTVLILAFFGATGFYGLVLGGQYDALRAQYGEPRDILARIVGFGLEKVTISGIAQLSEREVLTIGGINPRLSLPFLSAAEIRERLERTPLVKSAVVRKLYPNELAITLVEREPYALWQMNGELFVISADGTVIDRMRDPRFASLPLVVGDQANKRAASYVALLEAAGPLRSQIRAGMLVSGRRWTLKMENGVDVKLPEDDAPAAIARLARLAREQHILDKDVLALDFRLADRVVARLTEEAAAARAELVKKRPQRGTKGAEI
ncbi:cell division protein FtsQ/DivIB [Enterovirga aerilata]|uniref:Cell division protein FtsQ n=1 Tax=Enterovirga aerilata TaxID=2730920 RepID=A0A849I0K3_9HYPH|nr:cell division protein FtsQ/DivIB [Enterovirga sp. DB1703]NNM70848.1 FtsQ-type POTRA domain-containing protein [Enterovirga sp. DB1703]